MAMAMAIVSVRESRVKLDQHIDVHVRWDDKTIFPKWWFLFWRISPWLKPTKQTEKTSVAEDLFGKPVDSLRTKNGYLRWIPSLREKWSCTVILSLSRVK